MMTLDEPCLEGFRDALYAMLLLWIDLPKFLLLFSNFYVLR